MEEACGGREQLAEGSRRQSCSALQLVLKQAVARHKTRGLVGEHCMEVHSMIANSASLGTRIAPGRKSVNTHRDTFIVHSWRRRGSTMYPKYSSTRS